MSALAVCNNVTPVDAGPIAANIEQHEEVQIRDIGRRASFQDKNRGSLVEQMQTEVEPQLEASSPDEVALVKFGYKVRMRLMERSRGQCSLINISGKPETFDILASFPFTSESKKMGTLLKS